MKKLFLIVVLCQVGIVVAAQPELVGLLVLKPIDLLTTIGLSSANTTPSADGHTTKVTLKNKETVYLRFSNDPNSTTIATDASFTIEFNGFVCKASTNATSIADVLGLVAISKYIQAMKPQEPVPAKQEEKEPVAQSK